MSGAAPFGRVLTAMVTPFTADGSLDLDGAVDLARWLVEHGNDGLVLSGTTGESPTISVDEQVALWQAVREAVDVPLVLGTGSNDTWHACMMTERAADVGADAALVVTPYYNRPSQAGLEAHFRSVAAASELPVVLYDIPVRTGRKISTELLIRLANDVPNIVGLKDAAGNPGETARVVAGAPENFSVYSGDDSQTLPLLAIGAVGVVGVATHWCAAQMAELVEHALTGDLPAARRINAQLLASYAFESSDDCPNPGPTKAMLAELGLPGGPCRPPMDVIPDQVRTLARELIDQLGRPA